MPVTTPALALEFPATRQRPAGWRAAIEWLCHSAHMPRKVRDLIRDLKEAGFVDRGGRGSHRNFVHPAVKGPVTISGGLGDDARIYQEKAVKRALERLSHERR